MYLIRELALGPELMITQPNVLLTEMLFLGSMLMIYNCNKSCLGTCFLKTCTCEYTATVYLAERPCPANSPWLILCGTYLRMYALGKGLLELLQP